MRDFGIEATECKKNPCEKSLSLSQSLLSSSTTAMRSSLHVITRLFDTMTIWSHACGISGAILPMALMPLVVLGHGIIHCHGPKTFLQFFFLRHLAVPCCLGRDNFHALLNIKYYQARHETDVLVINRLLFVGRDCLNQTTDKYISASKKLEDDINKTRTT